MGYRHDSHYKFALATWEGNVGTLLEAIRDVPLDKTCKLTITPIKSTGSLEISGATLVLEFDEPYGYESPVLAAVIELAKAKHEDQLASLYTLCETAEGPMIFGIETWEQLALHEDEHPADEERRLGLADA